MMMSINPSFDRIEAGNSSVINGFQCVFSYLDIINFEKVISNPENLSNFVIGDHGD